MKSNSKELILLNYLTSLEKNEAVEKVLVNIKSGKDVDVKIKVRQGKLTACFVKIESDMYCKQDLNVQGVTRTGSRIKVLNNEGHTYFIELSDEDSQLTDN